MAFGLGVTTGDIMKHGSKITQGCSVIALLASRIDVSPNTRYLGPFMRVTRPAVLSPVASPPGTFPGSSHGLDCWACGPVITLSLLKLDDGPGARDGRSKVAMVLSSYEYSYSVEAAVLRQQCQVQYYLGNVRLSKPIRPSPTLPLPRRAAMTP